LFLIFVFIFVLTTKSVGFYGFYFCARLVKNIASAARADKPLFKRVAFDFFSAFETFVCCHCISSVFYLLNLFIQVICVVCEFFAAFWAVPDSLGEAFDSGFFAKRAGLPFALFGFNIN
jgi:hypothetical protein